MNLFERVSKLIEAKGISRNILAKRLDVPQNTLNRYFCAEHQDKLAQHLWTLLNLFPDVSREWLFFGEGEMLQADTPEFKPAREPVAQPVTLNVQVELKDLRRENAELNVELRGALKELRRLNEEKRELEERLKVNTLDPFAFDPPAESVSVGKLVRGVSGAGVSGQSSKEQTGERFSGCVKARLG